MSDPFSVYVSGNNAYVVSNSSNALEIIDISNPAVPVHKGSLANGAGGALLSNPRSVYVSGNYAYIASYSNDALEIVDISSSTTPFHKGSLVNGAGGALMDLPNSVFVSGNYAYVVSAGLTNALEIIDISGATISNAEIGTTKTTNLQVMNSAMFDQSVSIRGGLSIGSNGLLLSGDFGMSSPTSTDVLTATNTLGFSHTALFKSNATGTETNLFIFDTVNTFSKIASTTYLLSVRNNGTPAFSVASNGDVTASGTLFASSATIGTALAPGDLAERVDINPAETVEPGDVMIVDPSSTDLYRKSDTAYDKRVAGVISTNPSIIVGDARTGYAAVMAMVGRVPVKVSVENGPIMNGDLLVAASTTGYAMRYDPDSDIEVKTAGIVGIALESFATGTGKIMTLVRTGWVQNRNQTLKTMQTNIASIAAAGNVAIQTNPSELTVEQNSSGQIAYVAGQNLDLNNSILINVAGIRGKNDKWQIDEEGRFITKVAATNGDTRSLYAVQSEQTEIVISGVSTLESGSKKILFDEINASIINPEKNIKVSITLTSEANGVFVTDKSEKGFTVKELNNGGSNATFDWVVIAERKIGQDDEDAEASTNNSTPTGNNPTSEPQPGATESSTGNVQSETNSNTTSTASDAENLPTSSDPTTEQATGDEAQANPEPTSPTDSSATVTPEPIAEATASEAPAAEPTPPTNPEPETPPETPNPEM